MRFASFEHPVRVRCDCFLTCVITTSARFYRIQVYLPTITAGTKNGDGYAFGEVCAGNDPEGFVLQTSETLNFLSDVSPTPPLSCPNGEQKPP